jgi:hypothetical protein
MLAHIIVTYTIGFNVREPASGLGKGATGIINQLYGIYSFRTFPSSLALSFRCG